VLLLLLLMRIFISFSGSLGKYGAFMSDELVNTTVFLRKVLDLDISAEKLVSDE
jgi:hypothetical protein